MSQTNKIDAEVNHPGLRAKDHPQHAFLESRPDIFLALDKECRLQWMNSEAEHLFNTKRERALGRLVYELIPPAWEDVFKRKCSQVVAEHRAVKFENLEETSHHWYVHKMYPATDGGVAVYSREVVEHDWARAQSPEERLRLKSEILARTDDAVVAYDLERRVLYCNAAAEQQYQVRKQDVLGRPLDLVYRAAWLNPADEQRAESELEQKGSWTGEKIHIRHDGLQIFVSCSISKLSPEVGGGRFAVIRDVSERKRADLGTERFAAQLKRANDDLLHFAYAVSHDLQAPLRSSSSFTQLLALGYKHLLDQEGSEFLDRILEANARINTMLQDLLGFAKVAGGDVKVTDVDLEATLEKVLKNLRADIEESDATITHDALPVVVGESGQSVQLLQNLIGNALKYRKPNVRPAIHIASERSEDEWVISVQDNGLGFDQKYADRIFGVFKRLHNRSIPGTGIGLTISKRIVERLGGRMWATGEVGVGAVFSFTLPVPGAQSQRSRESEKPFGPPGEQLQAIREEASDHADYDRYFEESFRTLDLAPAVIRDLDGTIRVWTQGAERQFGWSKQAARGKKTHDLFETVFPKPLREIEADLLRAGSWTGELRHRTKEGRSVWHMSLWTLYRDGSGRPQSVIEVSNDITALKDAERALRNSSETRDLALEAGGMGVWHWNRIAGTIEWDEATQKLLHAEPGNLGGTFDTFLERVHLDDRSSFESAISQAFEKGPEYHSEFRITSSSENSCWLRSQGRIVLDEQQTAVGLVGLVWDITRRKRDELELRENEERFKAAFWNANIGATIASPSGRFMAANQYCCELTGYSEAELLELKFSEVVHPDDRAVMEKIQLMLDGELSDFVIENRYLRKDGAVVFVRNSVSLQRDAEGKPLRITALVEDIGERKRTEQALRDSESRYRNTFENAAVGIAEVTLDGHWRRVNQRLCDLLGYTKEELQTLTFADLTSKDEAESDQAQARALIQGNLQTISKEKRYQRKDGQYVWVDLSVSLLRDQDGKPEQFITVVQDIEERKRAEQLLRERDSQLQQMFDSIDQLAWMAYGDGFIFWYNRRWYEYTGATAEQMAGWGWQSIHDPEILPSVMERWTESISKGEPFDMEFPLRGADGVFRLFLTRIVPVRDSEGKVVRWFGTNTNIESLRKERDLLMESEQRFRELAEALPEIMWSADQEGTVQYFNPQFFDYTGVLERAEISTIWESLIHPDDLGRLLTEWRSSLGTATRYMSEARIRRHDGAYRWFLNRGKPILDESGRTMKWLGTSTDIHQQKITEEALRRSNADLEQFAYAASHDLREPLRMVSIYTQRLLQKALMGEEESQLFAQYVITGATRMDRLLDAIQVYLRAGEVPIEAAVTDSEKVLRKVLLSRDNSIMDSAASITYDSLPTLPCADEHLSLLFDCLIDNAVKYRDKDRPPKIHVAALPQRGWWLFSVQDNAIGIKREYLERIFGIFKRLYREEYPGVGIGLAIAKRIVEIYGGLIWAQSKPGEGSTFYFTLPAMEDR